MDVAAQIAERASVDDGFVEVASFLNHRVEPNIIEAVGARFASEAATVRASVVVTAEASGIPVAVATGISGHIPSVYAKKWPERPSRQVEARKVLSATKHTTSWLGISRSLVSANDRVLIVDDVLSSGTAACALVDIIRACGATVVGAAFVVEKRWLGGRERLADLGVELVSLTSVASPTSELQPSVEVLINDH